MKKIEQNFCLLSLLLITTLSSSAMDVNITKNIESVVTEHNNEKVTVQRIQQRNNRLDNEFTKTSRECPPFCIQPMYIDKVKTVGELEVLKLYLN